MLPRQKIAQTKAEHKGNSGDGAVQQHGSADFFFIQENEKGCRAAVGPNNPRQGAQVSTLERHPVQERLQCCILVLIWRYLFWSQPERMKAFISQIVFPIIGIPQAFVK